MIPVNVANALVDPSAHANRDIVEDAYSWLRKNAPLAQVTPDGFDTFWAVTKHADIKEIERQNEIFHNGGDRATVVFPTKAIEQIKQITGGEVRLATTILDMDGRKHFDHRFITQKEFMPKSLKRLQAPIEAIAEEFAEKYVELGGECDFAKDIAFLYPLRVLMEQLGVPKEDEPFMLQLTQELFGGSDPDINPNAGQELTAEVALQQQAVFKKFDDYFRDMIDDRRKNPRDDIASLLANTKIDGEHLGQAEINGYFMVIAAAGHDTTSNSTASGMWQIAENPQILNEMLENPDLIEGFVQESIRWETPVRHFMRNAAADAEISGQKIKKGDWLMMCYPSGNRDEEVFEQPNKFDIHRSPNDHISFGYGVHQCLGKHLALLEMNCFWKAILKRTKSVEFTGQPTRTMGNFVSGPKSIPISYQLA